VKRHKFAQDVKSLIVAIFELMFMEEVSGEYRGWRPHDAEQILVRMRHESALLLPETAIPAFEGVEIGSRISILRTDDPAQPVRVRKL
jgi:hypothetical protein